MKTLIGEYDRLGYTIMLADGTVIFVAGNHPQDSYQTLSPLNPIALPLRKIRAYCIKSGKEMASKQGYKWGGAERIENPND